MNHDYCTELGAQRLKRTIESYWSERGSKVKVWIEEQSFINTMRAASYTVRSDMVNGLPRKIVQEKRAVVRWRA